MTENIDPEVQLIGRLLNHPEELDNIAALIKKPEYFSDSRHRCAYKAMADLYMGSEPIDIVTVCRSLEEGGELKKAGGRTYIAELFLSYGSNPLKYAEIIVNNYKTRVLSEKFHELLKVIKSKTQSADNILADLEKTTTALSIRNDNISETLSDLLTDFVESVLTGGIHKKRNYVKTRVADLNNFITGLFKQDMTVVAGAPSSGKTAFVIDTLMHCTEQHVKSAFITIDQSKNSVVQRIITAETGLTKKQLYDPKINEENKKMIEDCMNRLRPLSERIKVVEGSGLNLMEMKSELRRLKRTEGIEAVAIDYIQQMKGYGYYDNRNLEVTDISRVLKEMAKELDVVMIVISQLNRLYDTLRFDYKKNEWPIPNISMLRDSGSIEQDANVVLFPMLPYKIMEKKFGEQSQTYRDWSSNINNMRMAYIAVAKNKDGETGNKECKWDARRMRFYSEDNRGIDDWAKIRENIS